MLFLADYINICSESRRELKQSMLAWAQRPQICIWVLQFSESVCFRETWT
ncbi:unnamed protein product [Staurois parvus]|uniref:Uncharacterized protein n=1 Tax=Staurois parvus TaxID=386267 RepID=A0ABN9DJJ2_9NEOB|nr:unnamed protein product [Staurois parvus]